MQGFFTQVIVTENVRVGARVKLQFCSFRTGGELGFLRGGTVAFAPG